MNEQAPSPRSKSDRPTSELIRATSGYGQAFGFIGTILVFALLGYLFDRWMKTAPWGLVVAIVVGFIGSTYKIVREASK
jgi:ATP synthase protein I